MRLRPVLLSLVCLILFAAPALSAGPASLTPAELKAMLQKKEPVVLIDVRTPEEFAAGHIPGSVLMPLDTLESVERIPSGGRVVIYCRSGRRSRRAYEILSKKGFRDLSVLEGGIEAWMASGGKVEKGPPRKP